jgi:hypothetical protein
LALVNRLSLLIFITLASWKDNLISIVENRKVQFDGWFVVLLAVLLTLAFTIFAGLTIWCVVYKGMKFSGDWKWNKYGVSVKAKCV